MTTPRPNEKTQTSLTQDLLQTAQYYLGGRRGLMVLAGVAIVAGLTFNWSWLVAAGIAPILIGVLPCVAMCAIGVCCMKKSADQSGRAGATEETSSQITSKQTSQPIHESVLEQPPTDNAGEHSSGVEAAPITNPDNQTLKERKSSDA